ncbi:MAG: hypothetical protein VKL59_03585 [Nostocaceae cyanobacterium]|nr:hypothetical protein [Nostocaceae cyanobacterium]
MKFAKTSLFILVSMGLFFLGACSGGTPENASADKTEATGKTAENTSKTEKTEPAKSSEKSDGHSHGGQVVETGDYHLELVTEKQDKGTALHFYLEKGEKHEPVANAKVTAQVQLPDGTEKALDLNYDAKGKEYTASLPGNIAGQYQMKVTADIGGEKVTGRFTINQ